MPTTPTTCFQNGPSSQSVSYTTRNQANTKWRRTRVSVVHSRVLSDRSTTCTTSAPLSDASTSAPSRWLKSTQQTMDRNLHAINSGDCPEQGSALVPKRYSLRYTLTCFIIHFNRFTGLGSDTQFTDLLHRCQCPASLRGSLPQNNVRESCLDIEVSRASTLLLHTEVTSSEYTFLLVSFAWRRRR
jgi:hypothetical protein